MQRGKRLFSSISHHLTRDPYASAYLETFPFYIAEHEIFGRGAFASRDIRQGEVVLIERPFLSIDPERCLATTKELLEMPGLQKAHKTRKMLTLISEALGYARYSSFFPISPLELSPINILSSTQSPILEADAKYLIDIGLVDALGELYNVKDYPEVWNEDIFHELFQRIKTNQYENGLYGMASMFNHSCFRNCMWEFRPPHSETKPSQEIIIALSHIKKDTQLFMAYSMDSMILNEGYGIPCKFDPGNSESGLQCACATERNDREFVIQFQKLVHGN